MKIKLLLCLFLFISCTKLIGQQITSFDSVVANIIGFYPVNIYPAEVQDSFTIKYQLRVDTNIQNVKKDYYYFRGYSKSYTPFFISFDSIEVQIIYGKGFEPDGKTFLIYVIGHLPYSIEGGEKVKKEVIRLAAEIEKKILPWSKSVSKKKAKLQYETFYFRNDNNSMFPHLGVGWTMNSRKKITQLSLRIAYSIH